eukprot:4779551-Amphidinium_carterae.1
MQCRHAHPQQQFAEVLDFVLSEEEMSTLTSMQGTSVVLVLCVLAYGDASPDAWLILQITERIHM